MYAESLKIDCQTVPEERILIENHRWLVGKLAETVAVAKAVFAKELDCRKRTLMELLEQHYLFDDFPLTPKYVLFTKLLRLNIRNLSYKSLELKF